MPEGETEEEYCGGETTIEGKTDWKPNMILDDGGDLTGLMHKEYKHLLKNVKGVSEETPQDYYISKICKIIINYLYQRLMSTTPLQNLNLIISMVVVKV